MLNTEPHHNLNRTTLNIMGRYKNFKTYIRKKIGLVGVAEFVSDPIAANSMLNWNCWFSNNKFVDEYATPARIKGYNDMLDVITQQIDIKDAGSLIDVGCGTGHFLVEINKRFPNITLSGTDFSESSINLSKTVMPKASFFRSDIYKEGDIAGVFDIVLCSEVLEHLLYPQKALGNLLLLLRAGGSSLVITIPNGRMDTYQGHINFWSPESWGVFINDNIDQSVFSIINVLSHNKRNIISVITKL